MLTEIYTCTKPGSASSGERRSTGGREGKPGARRSGRWGGPGLRGKQREDAAAGTHIHDGLAVKVRCVVEDGAVVSAGAHVVLQHVLLVLQHAVVVEVQRRTAAIRLAHKVAAALFPLLSLPHPPLPLSTPELTSLLLPLLSLARPFLMQALAVCCWGLS